MTISSINGYSSSSERRAARHLRRMEMEMERYQEFNECYGDYSNKSILIRAHCTIYGVLKIIMGLFITVIMIMVIPQVISQLM
jgi:hypothetical protein